MLRLFSFLVGPVFAKEMVEMARRKRYYLNRVLYGAVLLFTLFTVWKNYEWQFHQYGTSIRVMAQMAQSLFHAVSSVQYGAVFLFVPLFLCGVIASEREERTLEMLFTTALTDREIVLGKLISRVAVLIILIFCGLPIMSVIMFFGGIDPASLWRVLASTLLAILVTGAFAIYFSAITRSPMGALVRTYCWLAVWLLAVPLTCVLLLEGSSKGPNSPALRLFLGGMMLLHPVAPFAVGLDTFSYNQITNQFGLWIYPLAFVAPSAWSLFLIWRAIRRLRLAPTAFGRLWAALSPMRWLRYLLRGKRRAAGRRWFHPERLVFLFPVGNPLWLRARQVRVYDREGYVGRIQWLGWFAAGFFLVLIALVHPRAFSDVELPMGFLIPGWIGVAGLSVIFSANSLVGDRRRGFLELVLLTPLQPRQVIDGTFLAVWQHWRRAFWLPWGLSLLFLLMPRVSGAGLLLSLITATLFCTLLLFHGIACSLTARTVPGALVPAFLFPLLINIGVVFLMPMFETGAGPALWFLMVPFLLGSWFWMRRRPSVGGVACYFMAVHLVIAQLAVFWTWSGSDRNHFEYPIAAMHPAFLTVTTLGRPEHWLDGHRHPLAILVCYWTALVVNIVWARWWLIRNFEWLVERTGARAAARKSLLREQQGVDQMQGRVSSSPPVIATR